MKLERFRVTNFRSVQDSGWISTTNITALIGVNEAGKSNVMLPLWKLNPARGGEVHPLSDYPRKRFAELKNASEKPVFIQAEFILDEDEIDILIRKTKRKHSELETVLIERRLGGDDPFIVSFPHIEAFPTCESRELLDLVHASKTATEETDLSGNAAELRGQSVMDALNEIEERLSSETCSRETLDAIDEVIDCVELNKTARKEKWLAPFLSIAPKVNELRIALPQKNPASVEGVKRLILEWMPTFIYYSNYGNLDSEIYLPHVIDNMARTDMGPKEAARVRTLRVLFEFVQLSPQEIFELGKEVALEELEKIQDKAERDALVVAEREKKTERDVLLQSASARLTTEFREWWNQGDHTFDLRADGNHFRIWVADDKRPEKIELPGRSTGLQWFFSFYLIFLVESEGRREDTILLLDEPGLALHPLAQRDLSRFFENLSKNSQILYTTHSPFMVDSERLDQVKAVYVDQDGSSRVSSDLTRPAKTAQASYAQSIYPVNAAIGISSNDAYLLGKYPIIVEGDSDQHFLHAMKSHLISQGLLQPKQDFLFLPTSGVRGIKAVASLVGGVKESLPVVLVDGDEQGRKFIENVTAKKGLYFEEPFKILCVNEFTGRENDEIEDLWPPNLIAEATDRLFLRRADDDFLDVLDQSPQRKSIINQIEAFARQNDIKLELGWKVEIAKRIRHQLAQGKLSIPDGYAERWKELFIRLITPRPHEP